MPMWCDPSAFVLHVYEATACCADKFIYSAGGLLGKLMASNTTSVTGCGTPAGDAVSRHDLEAYRNLPTEHDTALPPGQPVVAGKQAMRGFPKKFMARFEYQKVPTTKSLSPRTRGYLLWGVWPVE
jgi:hypothetical protein